MKEEADCQDDGVSLCLKDEWMNDITTQRRQKNQEQGTGTEERNVWLIIANYSQWACCQMLICL